VGRVASCGTSSLIAGRIASFYRFSLWWPNLASLDLRGVAWLGRVSPSPFCWSSFLLVLVKDSLEAACLLLCWPSFIFSVAACGCGAAWEG
jgi:hypothetical protein